MLNPDLSVLLLDHHTYAKRQLLKSMLYRVSGIYPPPPPHSHVLPGLFTASTYFYIIQNYLHSSNIMQPITCLYIIVRRIG